MWLMSEQYLHSHGNINVCMKHAHALVHEWDVAVGEVVMAKKVKVSSSMVGDNK